MRSRRSRAPCRAAARTRRARTSHATTTPRSRMSAAIAVVLPPGDAHRSSTRSPGRAPTASGDELRRFVLDDRTSPSGGRRSGLPARDDEAVRRVARRLGLDALLRRAPRANSSRVTRSVLARSVSARRLVVEPDPALGGVEAITVEPARDEPVGMRVGDAEIRERGRAIAAVVRPRRQRQAVPLAERRCAARRSRTRWRSAFCAAPRQIHRVVHDRRRRHAIEVQQLVQAQAQDDEDVGVELAQRAFGEMLDQIIEAALPPQRAGDDFGGQRAVALVGQVLRGTGRARRGGRRARRRSRAARETPPCAPARSWTRLQGAAPGVARGCPARKSRAGIGRRPSGCSRSIAIRPRGRWRRGWRRA